MTLLNSAPPSQPNENQPATPPPKIPRLDSLLHRLQRARDGNGRPVPLLDELLFFLDDPPPGTGDRWQKGAELCQQHGIATSRMSVWRFYRAHILPWRRQQTPAPPATPPSLEETNRLHDQVRHLAAQRALEILNDPRLAPGHLVGLLQSENHRQQVQLARDQFDDRVAVRRNLERRQQLQRIEDHIRNERLIPAQMESFRKSLTTLLSIPPGNTHNGTSPTPSPLVPPAHPPTARKRPRKQPGTK